MRNFTMLAIAATMLVGATAAQATGTTFTTLDNAADPTFNQLLGINNAGVIVGYYGSGQAGHPNQAYTIASPYKTYTLANVPGSAQTQVTALNNTGATAGFFSGSNTGSDSDFGFIDWSDNGVHRQLLVNNAGAGGTPLVNQVLGINDNNIAVGFYVDANGASHGYSYSVATGTFTPLTIGGTVSVAATGINANNLICGFYVNGKGATVGFLRALSGGTVIGFRTPGSTVTQLLGVNSHGIAVGFYTDSKGNNHGLLYNPANGNWLKLDAPAAAYPASGGAGTVLNGLNDNGEIVGFYTDAASKVHGLLIQGAATQF